MQHSVNISVTVRSRSTLRHAKPPREGGQGAACTLVAVVHPPAALSGSGTVKNDNGPALACCDGVCLVPHELVQEAHVTRLHWEIVRGDGVVGQPVMRRGISGVVKADAGNIRAF